jgi:hypothetical protein
MLLTGVAGLRIKTDAYSVYSVVTGAVWVEPKASVEPSSTLLAAAPGPAGPSYRLAVDTTNVYWTTWGAATDGSGGTLMEVPLSLSPAKTLASGLVAPKDLAR